MNFSFSFKLKFGKNFEINQPEVTNLVIFVWFVLIFRLKLGEKLGVIQ
jgi:hypothetical protein